MILGSDSVIKCEPTVLTFCYSQKLGLKGIHESEHNELEH